MLLNDRNQGSAASGMQGTDAVSSNPYPVSHLVDNVAWKTAVISVPFLRSNARNQSNKAGASKLDYYNQLNKRTTDHSD